MANFVFMTPPPPETTHTATSLWWRHRQHRL